TVYGLACDPRCSEAVDRVYRIKHRPAGLELTLLAAAAADLDLMVLMAMPSSHPTASGFASPPSIAVMAARFWPGPLSIVLPVGPTRLAIPRAGSTLSVRVPAHELLRELLRRTGPLATTSANRHGEPPATTAAEVRAALGDAVDGVVDGGPAGGAPSTIIDCATIPPRLLREGPISLGELTPYLGGRPR
ncbi:MAG: L-threonylcarbamoyladenylate synthase, partial [Candidatus Dormibacteria bacterium]